VSIFISLITLFILVYSYKRYKKGHSIVGETLVLAGSISNILDRIMYGGVIDFIVVSFGSYSWPVFNIADIAIVIGAFIICVYVWRDK